MALHKYRPGRPWTFTLPQEQRPFYAPVRERVLRPSVRPHGEMLPLPPPLLPMIDSNVRFRRLLLPSVGYYAAGNAAIDTIFFFLLSREAS